MEQMRVYHGKTVLGVVVGMLAVAFMVLFGAAGSAKAAENKFCWGVTLTEKDQFCSDSVDRNIYALYANADGRVCVGAWQEGAIGCLKKANEGVYIGSPYYYGEKSEPSSGRAT